MTKGTRSEEKPEYEYRCEVWSNGMWGSALVLDEPTAKEWERGMIRRGAEYRMSRRPVSPQWERLKAAYWSDQ